MGALQSVEISQYVLACVMCVYCILKVFCYVHVCVTIFCSLFLREQSYRQMLAAAYGQRESFRYHTVKASEDLMVCFMHMLLTSVVLQGKSIVHPYIRVYCSEYSAYFGFVCSYYNNSNEFVSMETIKIIFL